MLIYTNVQMKTAFQIRQQQTQKHTEAYLSVLFLELL